MKPIKILVPYDLFQYVKQRCEPTGESFAGYIRRLIAEDRKRQREVA